jgi:hypothetical protein
MGAAGAALLGLGVVTLLWPWAIAAPLAVLVIWLAASLLCRAWTLHRERTEDSKESGD